MGERIRTSEKRKLSLEEEERSLSYLNYPTRPILLEAKQAIDEGVILYDGSDILYRPKERDLELLQQEEVRIKPSNQYDLVSATIFGLNEALAKAEAGGFLREIFDKEKEVVDDLESLEGDLRRYGIYAYYPGRRDIVHFASEEYHRLALITSNSRLLQDPEYRFDWKEVRSVFDDMVVAVAGASVGNNIAHSLAMDIRPKKIKIADPRLFKLSNFNRVRGGYWDVVWSNEYNFGLKNKAIGLAEQIHAIDPFMDIWVYIDGVNEGNIGSFVKGNRVEPKSDFVIEETDNPIMKLHIREKAREAQVRVVMASDVGSAVQIDIRPFDSNPNASLAVGIDDEVLYEKLDNFRKRKEGSFVEFGNALIGTDYKRGEFGMIIDDKIPRMFSSIPQLGSTASMAAGLVTEVVARTALGYKFPERFIVDKSTLEIITWDEYEKV